MSLALVDQLVKLGVRCKHAECIYHAIDRLQITDLHPDDLASILFVALKNAYQAGYEAGMTDNQMVLQIPAGNSTGGNNRAN